MATKIFTTEYLEELQLEVKSTRKCLERIPESTYDFKPHETSMNMKYLVELVAAIPLWIVHMIEKSEIDFVTFPRSTFNTTADLVAIFDQNVKDAEKALQNADDEILKGTFSLKANGKVMYTSPKKTDIRTTLNHWVHHRGQLTVYMRMNNISVPSIYGPSADDKSF